MDLLKKFGAGAALAPMAGVTDMPMRLLCFEKGAAWAVTEMVSAKGYICAPENNRAVSELLRHDASEGPLGLQLFGREPDYMAMAVEKLSGRGWAFIDINMGCPAHRIVGNGEGSALMKTPELAGEIIRAAVKASEVPVTVKMRAGWDEEHINAVEMAIVAQQAGASAITVHPRTRVQQYSGHSDWSVIRDVKKAVSIPVIGNGDVTNADEYERMLRETGCDAVAIGRAAQGNPWIFEEIRARIEGREWKKPTVREKIDTALRHGRMQAEYIGAYAAAREMRKHLIWYLQGMSGCAKVREQLTRITDMDALEALLNEYAARLERREREEQ
jgi:nifR3 family TIM-barrel protein